MPDSKRQKNWNAKLAQLILITTKFQQMRPSPDARDVKKLLLSDFAYATVASSQSADGLPFTSAATFRYHFKLNLATFSSFGSWCSQCALLIFRPILQYDSFPTNTWRPIHRPLSAEQCRYYSTASDWTDDDTAMVMYHTGGSQGRLHHTVVVVEWPWSGDRAVTSAAIRPCQIYQS